MKLVIMNCIEVLEKERIKHQKWKKVFLFFGKCMKQQNTDKKFWFCFCFMEKYTKLDLGDFGDRNVKSFGGCDFAFRTFYRKPGDLENSVLYEVCDY